MGGGKRPARDGEGAMKGSGDDPQAWSPSKLEGGGADWGEPRA